MDSRPVSSTGQALGGNDGLNVTHYPIARGGKCKLEPVTPDPCVVIPVEGDLCVAPPAESGEWALPPLPEEGESGPYPLSLCLDRVDGLRVFGDIVYTFRRDPAGPRHADRRSGSGWPSSHRWRSGGRQPAVRGGPWPGGSAGPGTRPSRPRSRSRVPWKRSSWPSVWGW